MKKNLKNFPKLDDWTSDKQLVQFVLDAMEWKEDFEAELREIAKAWEGLDYHGIETSPDLNIIKEILGE